MAAGRAAAARAHPLLPPLPSPPGGGGAGGQGSGGGRAGRGGGGAAALASPSPARPQPEGAEPPPAPGGGCRSAAQPGPSAARTNWKSALPREADDGGRCRGLRHGPAAPAAAAAGGECQPGESRSLSLDRNPRGSGFPEGRQNLALGSQMLGTDGRRGAPMPGSTEERPGFSGRRGDPEIQGRDADQRCARMRAPR